jgi:hypothetical protein
MQRTATCSCGQLSITLKRDPLRVHCCNCMECHKMTGSAFSTAAYWDDENVVSISGEHRRCTRSSEFGRSVTWHFCLTCGGKYFIMWNCILAKSASPSAASTIWNLRDPSWRVGVGANSLGSTSRATYRRRDSRQANLHRYG